MIDEVVWIDRAGMRSVFKACALAETAIEPVIEKFSRRGCYRRSVMAVGAGSRWKPRATGMISELPAMQIKNAQKKYTGFLL